MARTLRRHPEHDAVAALQAEIATLKQQLADVQARYDTTIVQLDRQARAQRETQSWRHQARDGLVLSVDWRDRYGHAYTFTDNMPLRTIYEHTASSQHVWDYVDSWAHRALRNALRELADRERSNQDSLRASRPPTRLGLQSGGPVWVDREYRLREENLRANHVMQEFTAPASLFAQDMLNPAVAAVLGSILDTNNTDEEPPSE